jgi:hypothetical protein
VGWAFSLSVPPTAGQQVLITQLGVYDAAGSGFVNEHPIGLWKTGPAGDVLVASATVPEGTSAPFFDGFRYVPINPDRGRYESWGAFFPQRPGQREERERSNVRSRDTPHLGGADEAVLQKRASGAERHFAMDLIGRSAELTPSSNEMRPPK